MKYCRKSCEFPPKFGGFDFIGKLYVVMAEHKLYRTTLNSCYVEFSWRKQQNCLAGLEATATVLPQTQLFLRYFTRPYLADPMTSQIKIGGEIAVWPRETNRDIGLLSPGGIIPHEILHYQFVLNRLLLSSFNSFTPRKPLKWSILMAARICATNYPHSWRHFISNCG